MTYKNQGPDVSENPQAVVAGGGQYTADEHSFESVVFQQDKPVLDWELNLLQEILGQAGTRLLALRTLPTCFLTGDFLERPDLSGSYTFDPTTANQFGMAGANLSVNGWPVRFEYSGTTDPGQNLIDLPDPPGGGHRLDLVILEVWRALVSPSPSTTNKSPTGQLLRNGNAKAADQFPPGNVNLVDDLVDPTYTQGTQRRVQIQYRYRVISGAVLDNSVIDGFGTILSRSVPYQAGSDVDGEAPLVPLAYTSASSASYGLWVAGSGNATTAASLGTVDGYMYAVPLCAVHRRNTAPFDEATNRNGGALIASGVSDRPDGLYSDQIVDGDVVDLRHSISWALDEVLDKSFQSLLDNTLCSGDEVFVDGLNTVGGTSFLVGDDVGLASQHIGKMDGVRAHFSDRRVTECAIHVESVVASVSLGMTTTSVNLPWAPGTNVAVNAPPGTRITGVPRVRLVNPGVSDVNLLTGTGSPRVTRVLFSDVAVTINLDTPVTGDVYIEVQLEYPTGCGAQRNVVEAEALWTPDPALIAAWAEPLQFSSAGLPAGRFTLPEGPGSPLSGVFWWSDPGHREFALYIPGQATSGTFVVSEAGTILLPDLVTVATSGTGGVTVSNFEFSGAYTELTLAPAQAPGTPIVVNYAPFRAPPPSTDHYTFWYKSRAIQSLDPPAGTQTLRLVPRCISKSLHVITTGSGSPDSGFPYDAAGVQIPIPTQPPGTHPEALLDSPSSVSIGGFGMNSGYLQLPALIPYSPNPSQVQLFRDAVDGVLDGDNRRFWPKSDDGGVPIYSPTVFGQSLTGPMRHKVACPVICELKDDFSGVGVKGTLVLVVFCSWSEFSAINGISMSSIPSDAGAAVYKLRGGFLNPRRADV